MLHSTAQQKYCAKARCTNQAEVYMRVNDMRKYGRLKMIKPTVHRNEEPTASPVSPLWYHHVLRNRVATTLH